MANNTAQLPNQAQHIAQSIFGSMQGIFDTQVSALQRLGDVQQTVFQQTVEAANDQLQLIARMRNPREYASAQANLVKEHGQRYVDSIKQAVDITAEAWKVHADRLDKGVDAIDKAQSASRKAA